MSNFPPTSKEIPIGGVANMYGVMCNRCLTRVQPFAGFVFKESPQGKWIGEHFDCPETDGGNDDESLRWDQRWGG